VPGSGRKRDYAQIRVTLSNVVLAAIDKERGGRTRTSWVAELIATHLDTPRRRRLIMPEAAWPALPDPNPVPQGTDLRTTRKGRFSTGQRFDHEAQLRQVAAIRYKSQGKTDAEIAEILGYSTAQNVRSAIQYAMRRYVPFEVAEYAKVILAEHFRDLERLELLIEHPGYKFDIKGDLITGPDGEFLEDEDVRIAALTEKRKTEESIRRLTGADAPKRSEHTVHMDEDLNSRIQKRLAELDEIRARLRPVAALPDDSEDDIVEAEIVPDEQAEEEDSDG
jgi:hypothetical protein